MIEGAIGRKMLDPAFLCKASTFHSYNKSWDGLGEIKATTYHTKGFYVVGADHGVVQLEWGGEKRRKKDAENEKE